MHKKPSLFELKTLEDYSDKALLDELRRVATALNGKRLTHDNFNQLSRVHSTTLRLRFGSWKNALDLAGISKTIATRFDPLTLEKIIAALHAYAKEFPESPVTKNEIAHRLGVDRGTISRKFGKWKDLLGNVGLSPVPHGRRYTDEECFENIIVLWTHYGRQPHFAELNQPPSTVGAKAYVSRWGGWRAALSAFIKRANRETEVVQAPNANKSIFEKSTCNVSSVSAPRSLSLSLRYNVLCRDKFRCVRCGRSPAQNPNIELHVDHIKPWSKGGPNTEENLRTLCSDCNIGKGSRIENE